MRLGHPHHGTLTNVLKKCKISVSNKSTSDFCNSCSIAKSHKLPSMPSVFTYNSPLELVFFDVRGQCTIESSCGFLYFLTCVDACTKFTSIYPLQRKSEILSKVQLFKVMAEKQFDVPLKGVQTDFGGEFRPLASFLQKQGVFHRITCPHTHHQNGSVERKHRHIVELGLALLHHASLPLKFWDHAFLIAAFLINRLPA